MDTSHNVIVAGTHTCFAAYCTAGVRWGVSSSVKTKNPDGTPLTLYACDEHEPVITAKLRSAGTRYQLFPVEEPCPNPGPGLALPAALPPRPKNPEEEFASEVKRMPFAKRIILSTILVVVGIVVTPIIIIIYGVKWLCGWRPTNNA